MALSDSGVTPRHRVFFALWPDSEAASHLAALGQALAGSGSRRVSQHSLHVTLAFLGGVPRERLQALKSAAAGVKGESFDLALDRIGFWPQRGLLWAGCRETPPQLRCLAMKLEGALIDAGFAPEGRADAGFVPHVTLARRVRCRELPRLATPVQWRVREFSLVESQLLPAAASYRNLAEFALASS